MALIKIIPDPENATILHFVERANVCPWCNAPRINTSRCRQCYGTAVISLEDYVDQNDFDGLRELAHQNGLYLTIYDLSTGGCEVVLSAIKTAQPVALVNRDRAIDGLYEALKTHLINKAAKINASAGRPDSNKPAASGERRPAGGDRKGAIYSP